MSIRITAVFILTFGISYLQAQNDDLSIYIQQLNNSLTENESITSLAFSANGKELYFIKSIGIWGKTNLKGTIYVSHKKKGKWTSAGVASFSGKFDDGDISISPDGKQILFISDRPTPNGDTSSNIWAVKRKGKKRWGEPYCLENMNSPKAEYSPQLSSDGYLYFASDREGGLGQGDLYKASSTEDGFDKPVNLGQALNSSTGEWNLYVNPEKNFLLFEASQRPENASPYGDLFISFFENGKWSTAQHISEFATTGSELNPILDASGLLYYISTGAIESPSAKVKVVPFQTILEKYVPDN